jgi:hypothetical protein
MATRILRTSRWYRVTVTIAAVLIAMAGGFYAAAGDTLLLKGAGVAGIVFAVAAFADAFVSRIVLDDEALHIISLVHRRTYSRSGFASAKVDGGQVALKKRDGEWVVLPGTGANALAVRNTVHAWITRGTKDKQEAGDDVS